MAVNLGDLDELGLAYPSADWTSAEAARLFQAATRDKGGQHRYGFSPVFRGRPFPSAGPLPNALYDPPPVPATVKLLQQTGAVRLLPVAAALAHGRGFAGYAL